MQNPATCCPGRPAHSRSRAFFQAAATLALIAGGLSGSLGTQALATDYTNPLGHTETGSQQFHDTPAMNFTNLGTINTGSSNVSAMMLYGGQTVTLFTNSGDIINETQIGVNLYTRPADVQLWASVPSLITQMNNSGNIIGAISGLQLGTLTDTIVHLTNTGTISGGILSGPYGGESGINIYGSGIITTIDNSGTIAGKMYGINSSGSIGTINLLNGSTLTGQNNSAINNTGTIGAINLQSGATINGGITNSGVITSITNASSTNNVTNSGTITSLANTGTIVTIRNTGTIASFTGDNGGTVTSFINDGTLNNVSGNGISLSTSHITTLTNNGTIAGDWVILLNLNSSITTLNNNGNITGATDGINNQGWSGNVNTITTLTNTGTISGGTRWGIASSGVITTLNNSGTISGQSVGIINWGTITTLNNYGTISGNQGEAIANQGTIGTLNLFSGSVLNGQITNSGSIGTLNLYKTITSGDFNSASMAPTISGNQPGTTNRYATINNGTTVGTFTNSVNLSTLTNAGTINTFINSASKTVGTITNSGVITTLSNSSLIGSITNSGTIGTLNLLSGWAISGAISNPGTINVLNVTVQGITCHNYDVVLPDITGNAPGTINFIGLPGDDHHSTSTTGHGRRASIDTSGFGANASAILQVSVSIAHLGGTNDVIQSIGAKATKHAADPYTMTSDLCADGTPTPAAQIGNSDFWLRGFTGRNNVDATASSVNYINTYSGGAVGIDHDWSSDVRGGVFIGAGTMKNSLGGGLGGTDTNLIFAGTYATKTWGTTFAKVGLTGGRGSNTGTRNIAGSTPETATADYKSWYVSPEVSLGNVYVLGQGLGGDLSVTPVISVRYVYASQDGYTETGATSNLTMGSSHSTTVEERAELKFSYDTKAFTGYDVKINASVGGISQQNTGGAMNGTLLGAPLSFATPGQTNSNGFVGGLGFEVNRGRYTFSASGDYVRLSGGNADLSANVVLRVKF